MDVSCQGALGDSQSSRSVSTCKNYLFQTSSWEIAVTSKDKNQGGIPFLHDNDCDKKGDSNPWRDQNHQNLWNQQGGGVATCCNCVNVNGFIRTFLRKNIFVSDIFVKVYVGTKTSPKTMFHSMGGVLGEWELYFWKPCLNLFGGRFVPQSRHEHCEGRKRSENILTMKGFRETFHIYFWFSPAAQLAQLWCWNSPRRMSWWFVSLCFFQYFFCNWNIPRHC
jgi:hypothetical protein